MGLFKVAKSTRSRVKLGQLRCLLVLHGASWSECNVSVEESARLRPRPFRRSVATSHFCRLIPGRCLGLHPVDDGDKQSCPRRLYSLACRGRRIEDGLKFLGGTVRTTCQLTMVKPLLLVCILTVLLQTNQTVAQVENSVSSLGGAPASDIQYVAAESSVTLSPQEQFLQLLDRAIETTSKRTLTANSHSPWQIFHCILALRDQTVLRLGDQKVNAIEWLSTAEPQFDKQPWLLLTPHGAKFHPYTRMYAFEGHPSQFLALLSHTNLPNDYPFHVQGKVVTLNDLVNNTMKEVNTKEEVTWVLWALQHFLKPDAVWTNQANETWSIERLVKIESEAAVVGAPCGGNHRLFALTRARDKYLAQGGKLRGVWFQADQKVKQHIEIARSLQNADGSFSSDFYKGPGHTTDVNKRFNTTGHTMEFLAVALPKERLNEPWVRNAVWMLSRELILQRDTKIDCGPLFHSLDALILYRERLRASEKPSETPDSLATKAPAAIAQGLPKLETVPQKLQAPQKPVQEPKSVAQVPEDVKPVTPELKSVPIPIPEPILLPESKADEPRLDPPALPIPQAKRSAKPATKSVATKSQTSPTNSGIPRLDPSKLPNVGQVATLRTSSEPLRTSRLDRDSTSPPALLPDLAATPLDAEARMRTPLPIELPEVPVLGLKLKSRSSGKVKDVGHDCGAGPVIDDKQKQPPVLVEDEPVSALNPDNP